MNSPRQASVTFVLGAPSLRYSVGVEIRCVARRWIAVADTGSARQVALGSTARAALETALVSLSESDAKALLADTVLFGASAEMARQLRERPA